MKSRGALPALVHWLVLICGLALLTALRIDELEKMLPLWIGALLGTAIGQLLARGRLRMWLAGFIVVNLLWLAPIAFVPIWPLLGAQPWAAIETLMMALAPAAVCGYLSLSERGALAAFWFPAVPWVVALLDESKSLAIGGAESWLLLGALAILLLGFLRAREARRVALWRGYATTRLATPVGEAVLRQAPLRRLGQIAWMGAVGAATLGLTGWIAPSLWQKDDVAGKRAAARAAVSALDGDDAPACCPEVSADAAEKKVKEYLPIQRTHAQEEPRPVGCVTCIDGQPVPTKVASSAPSEPVAEQPTAAPAAPPPLVPKGSVLPTPSAPAPVAAATTLPVAPSADKAPSAKAPRARSTPAGRPARAHVVFVPGEVDLEPLAWMLALAVSATAVQLGLRPLRRLIVLRHLQRPLWPETVDQRVSNLWQLMLVGLRDAGWQATPGEQPQELARRVGLEGMKTCATVLERARHGVRVDGADLEAMESAARAVYRAAHGQIGLLARALAWLRWPLV
jgi:hypothetical protein